MNAFDVGILDFIQKYLKGSFLDKAMPFITHLGDGGVMWIAIGVLFIGFRKTRKMGMQMCLAMLLGFLIGNLGLKVLIGRERPFIQNKDILLLIAPPNGYSFPSGHTLSSFSATISIFLCNKRLGVVALILAGLIAFSRMYLYVHFPTDIMGGILLAIVMAFVSRRIIEWLTKK